jgi:TonB family protein
MAPSTKENEVLTATPEKSSTVSVPHAPRFDETATASRPQPVALEIPVTVNGARTVEGSDKREPFSETTKTVLVFGNGAVIRLGSPVAAGQLLFLTNEKTKKEVVCQVVKSKNYKSVSGYVELEFTESVVGFWGMRFPSDRIGAPAPVAAPIASVPPAAKPNPVVPIAAVTAPVVPAVIPSPKISEVKPAHSQTPQIQAGVPAASQPRPAGVTVAPLAAPKPQAPSVQSVPAPAAPVANKADSPVTSGPAASSLASSLASLLGAPEVPPAVVSHKPPAQPLPIENKTQPTRVVENSSEELKLQAARLQEQLSSLLFSAAPSAKPASPAPVVPALDAKTVSGTAAQVLEIAKSEPSPIKIAPPAKPLPAPIKSSLDTEEVKIPSWLEPLARNAAAPPSTQQPVEREKAKQATDAAGVHEARPEESLSLTALENVPESALPVVGSLLSLEEEVLTKERSSSGSGKGALYGAIAAAVLLAAGGAWYFLHPANGVQSTTAPVTSASNSQASAASPAPSITQPVSQPAAQNSAAAPLVSSGSNTPSVSNVPTSSAPVTKSSPNLQPAPVTRDNTRGAGTTIPAAATERISRPPAEPEPKKPALGEVHLASPTMNRAAAQDDGAEAPTISSGDSGTIAGGLGSGLPAGNAKQPAAPEVPLPIGGDVKTAKLISSVSPIYPAMAKNQHIAGDVRVDALIDANGRVTTTKVISGPALLHQAAMDALRQWKYQPATLDGKAVPMHLTVTIQFRLQ